MAKSLRITQVRSGIRRPKDQRKVLIALGLGKMQKTVEHADTPMIRGMVKKIIHLLSVEEIN